MSDIHDRETTVVERGGSGGSWFLAGILVVVLIVAAVFYVNGGFTGDKADITVEVPKVEVPAPAPSE